MSATVTPKSRSDVSRASTSSVIIGVLLLLTLVGGAAGVFRLFTGLGASTALSDDVSWGIWIGFDFGLIAFAGAGFTLAAVVHIFHLEQFHRALRPALLVGLLGYVAVLALLVLDLGRLDRFYHFLMYWNRTRRCSRSVGVCCCTPLCW